MATEERDGHALTRREALKRALKAGTYAAPAILSVSVVAPVAAATPAPTQTSTPTPVPAATPAPTPTPVPAVLCTQPVTFFQDALLLGVFPGAVFDLYAQASNAATATRLGALTADRLGVATGIFTLRLDTSAAASVALSVYLVGTAPPAPPAATFVSALVAALACTAGGPRTAAQLVAKVIQEPTATACGLGVLNEWQEVVDVNLVNAAAGAAYDVYVRPSNIVGGAFVKAGTLPATNGQGNTGAILPVTIATTGGAPSAVTINLVPIGLPATPASYTFTATPTGDPATSTLRTVSCAGAITPASGSRPILLAVR